MKILYNIKAFAMDKECTRATAIAWENGTITRVGEKQDLIRECKDAETIDGQGLTLVPAFIDPHIHFMDGTVYQGALDCSPAAAPDIQALKVLLAKEAAKHKKGEWIVAQGYDPWAYPQKRTPLRHDLDQACPNNPVVIIHYSFHECAANSRALALAGIDRDSLPPFAGIIKKDRQGNPTGHLIETAMEKVLRLSKKELIARSDQKILQRTQTAQQKLFEFGITRIGDPAVDHLSRKLYQQAFEQGMLKLTVFMFPCNEQNMLKLPLDKLDQPFQYRDNECLKTGHLKIFLDGADRTAMALTGKQLFQTIAMTFWDAVRTMSLTPVKTTMRSPVKLKKDGLFHFGLILAEPDKCGQLVQKAVKKGFSPAFHAIGNEAVQLAVELISQNMPKASRSGKTVPPPRIEHGLFLNNDLIRRIKESGAAVVTQPLFLTHMDKENLPHMPEIKKLPLRSMIDQGIPVAGSSDFPVVSCNPLLGIEHAVTRVTKGSETLDQQEAVTVEQAFAMYTRQAAFVLGCLDDTGTLSPGKRADFILLSGDPLDSSNVCWHKVKVQKTYMNGKVVFP